jgi:hypothetical protein
VILNLNTKIRQKGLEWKYFFEALCREKDWNEKPAPEGICANYKFRKEKALG